MNCHINPFWTSHFMKNVLIYFYMKKLRHTCSTFVQNAKTIAIVGKNHTLRMDRPKDRRTYIQRSLNLKSFLFTFQVRKIKEKQSKNLQLLKLKPSQLRMSLSLSHQIFYLSTWHLWLIWIIPPEYLKLGAICGRPVGEYLDPQIRIANRSLPVSNLVNLLLNLCNFVEEEVGDGSLLEGLKTF